MRLLQVTRQYVPEVIGGYERNCQRFSEEWARRGHQVTVLTRQVEAAPPVETVNGVHVHRTLPDVPSNRRVRGIASRWYQLRIGRANRASDRAMQRVLEQRQPDAVVFWGMNSWVVSPVLAAHRMGVPCLADLGDYWLAESLDMYAPASPRQAWYRQRIMLGGRLTPEMFREVWVHSAYMQRLYRDAGLPADRVRVIPRGLEPSMTQEDPGPLDTQRRPLRILCVGRLVPDKGARVLARAFAKVRQSHSDVELHFYGDAWEWYKRELEEDCRATGLLDRGIYIHDRVEPGRMRSLYREHDILAFPVLWDEPSSNVLLEAMAMRLPIVASRTGSNEEFVQDGSTGFLVPPDQAADLAQRLDVLLQDAELRQRMGGAARQHVLSRHLQQQVYDANEARLLHFAG